MPEDFILRRQYSWQAGRGGVWQHIISVAAETYFPQEMLENVQAQAK